MFKIKKFDLLVSIYIGCLIMAEIMGGKVFVITSAIHPFGRPLSASVGIFLIPILFSINDVISEVHGKERAQSVIRSGLVMLIFLALFSLFTIQLPASSRSPITQEVFVTIFSKSIRMTLASLIAFVTSEFLDVYIFSKIRELFGTSKLWLRNNLSNFISQFIDTTIFITLAFYAINQGFGENLGFLISLILPYWLLKCFMSIIETPFVYLGVKWLKK